MAKRQPSTKDIGLLLQLYEQNQLELAPEFQRSSVWPRPAKAYLIDTILKDRPIPLIFLQRSISPQTGRTEYSVIDGQQRLRAIIEFYEGRFRLTQSDEGDRYFRKKFSQLTPNEQEQFLTYDLIVQELHGYSEADIKDSFIRINKYVVKLSPQELRHAKEEGRFADFVERVGKWPVWTDQKIITGAQAKRMRAVEFAAELAILLLEGPQDKKSAIDLYYVQYRNRFPYSRDVENRLRGYLEWITSTLPNFSGTRYRKPVDLYSLIGALDDIVEDGRKLTGIPKKRAAAQLQAFERQLKSSKPPREAARYAVAASRQTDNITPRTTRITVLKNVLLRG